MPALSPPPMPSLADRLDRWREDLASWAIPEHITPAAGESPWVLPRQVFARRADRLAADPAGPSWEQAWAALSPPGTVLDVGSGAGAACLPLAARSSALTAVDTDAGMLDMLTSRARAAGLVVTTVLGAWPDLAGQVPAADVVTSHHVLYNVPALEPFLSALTSRARRRVVVEIAAQHPLTSLNPLWMSFHGLRRPQAPDAGDVLDILAAMGVRAEHSRWTRPAEADYRSMEELVDVTRRRLCLPAYRCREVEAALLELGIVPGRPSDLGSSGREVVTIWWEGTA